MENIVLIGMPGCGKSTCGVLVAKSLCMDFVDTDLLIQKNEGASLIDIIKQKGNEYFAFAEENAVCGASYHNSVIATGGSIVYSKKAVEYLKSNSTVVYLKISYESMVDRISNIESRGILLRNGESMKEMFDYRQGLYEKYADIILDCNEDTAEQTVSKIVSAVNK